MTRSEAEPMLRAGTVLLETYEIVRQIGRGGMGEVYEARHARLPGRYAVKVLHRGLSACASDLTRLQREAMIASSLRHPNIVQVIDFNHAADGAPFIAMEYLEGADLGTLLERAGQLSPPRVAAICRQVGAAIAAAHGQGIVHRDLKPQNVFLVPVTGTTGDHVKVLDFGISKIRTATTITGDTHVLGTPRYMSPEQAEGRGDEVDGRTDQFALAVMAHEMLSGKPMFPGESVPSVLYQVSTKAPEPLAGIVPGVSVEVDRVLARALSKDKGRRYPTILELTDALASALLGAPGAVGRSEMVGETLRPVARGELSAPAGPRGPRRIRRGVVAGAAVVALATVLWAAGGRSPSGSASALGPGPSVARRETSIASPLASPPSAVAVPAADAPLSEVAARPSEPVPVRRRRKPQNQATVAPASPDASVPRSAVAEPGDRRFILDF